MEQLNMVCCAFIYSMKLGDYIESANFFYQFKKIFIDQAIVLY